MSDCRSIEKVGQILCDRGRPLTDRFRALFTLRNLGGKHAIDSIVRCLDDPSALLKHELAYCMGQMQDPYAIPYLVNVLKDTNQEPMVRHEAGEALGAIGSPAAVDILKEYASDPVVEVAETCELALKRIEWLHSNDKSNLTDNPFTSVDPAPPSTENNIETLRTILLDENLPLFERYRAMFSLRNNGCKESVLALSEGLKCGSALFRHEIAYVLGQMQHEAAAEQLIISLRKPEENAMVRHECAEALGSIAKDECMKILKDYSKDEERVVRESCEVALDMYEYEKSNQFQYADALSKVAEDQIK
ncbi:deoxyhypusine hydroxylase-like [Saccoglossus kowalevskii]|uniref:Deoxyhypusine hydroxylase n=1 Tax=Saccoglossus kowalevskii TaxID=10224 RepID=A0ABM0GJQ1_SACKO|nr:PREDICTED: deoxyhypusine hydroxylase-like [Saccoglossus kowalevskii]